MPVNPVPLVDYDVGHADRLGCIHTVLPSTPTTPPARTQPVCMPDLVPDNTHMLTHTSH
uniref:Uncharacterized protein n=1 Tax=Anopheles albimanus TaxID=7167 RepID=A0A182FX62_ANOAL